MAIWQYIKHHDCLQPEVVREHRLRAAEHQAARTGGVSDAAEARVQERYGWHGDVSVGSCCIWECARGKEGEIVIYAVEFVVELIPQKCMCLLSPND